MESLPSTATVVIFDTGTMGNGPRRIWNVLNEFIPSSERLAVGSVSIVGLVDGRDDAQKDKQVALSMRTGRQILVRMRYIPVPQVLSEDCEILIGYDRNRSLGYLLPLRDTAVFRLMDEHNRCIQIRGTDNASHVFQTLMSAALEQTAGTGEPLTAEVEKGIVANIAKVSQGVEFSDLLGAHEMGLVSRPDFERGRNQAAVRGGTGSLPQHGVESYKQRTKTSAAMLLAAFFHVDHIERLAFYNLNKVWAQAKTSPLSARTD